MVKVIGKDPRAVYAVTCKSCASILEYVRADVTVSVHRYYDGSSDNYKYVKCPTCNNKVEV